MESLLYFSIAERIRNGLNNSLYDITNLNLLHINLCGAWNINSIFVISLNGTRTLLYTKNVSLISSLSTENEKILAYGKLVNHLKFKANEERTHLIEMLKNELNVFEFTHTMLNTKQVKISYVIKLK